MIYRNVFAYGGYRYLWWALAVSMITVVIYASHDGSQPPSGGTWQGYTLGTIAVLLVIWLALLGIRKRTYSSRMGTVQGWTSAHVYFGLALILIATLHCASQFGWNVHTLAYVLLILVVASGIVGVLLYLRLPQGISSNRKGGTRAQLFEELHNLDKRARQRAQSCEPAISEAVISSIERLELGGGVLAQLFAVDRSKCSTTIGAKKALVSNADQGRVIDIVASRIPRADKQVVVEVLQELLSLLNRRQVVLRRLRRDVRQDAWLQVWLYIHIPVTIALLAALIVHIVVVFMYW